MRTPKSISGKFKICLVLISRFKFATIYRLRGKLGLVAACWCSSQKRACVIAWVVSSGRASTMTTVRAGASCSAWLLPAMLRGDSWEIDFIIPSIVLLWWLAGVAAVEMVLLMVMRIGWVNAIRTILKTKRMWEGVHERLRGFGHRYCSMLILASCYHPLSMLVLIMTSVAMASPTNVLLKGTASSLSTWCTSRTIVADELFLRILLVEFGDVQIRKALAINSTTTSTLRWMRYLNRVHLGRMCSNAAWRLCISSAHILRAVAELTSLFDIHDSMRDVLGGCFATQIDRIVALLACSRVLLAGCDYLGIVGRIVSCIFVEV